MSDPHWEIVASGARLITENWLFRLWSRVYRSRRSGRDHTYYVAELPDCVHVIALTPEPDRRIVLVRQFRAASAEQSLEVPGGLVDPGEDPAAAGVRELLEETGYAGDPPVVLPTYWCNPSLLTAKVTAIVVANAKRISDPQPDSTEELEIELAPASEIPAMVRSGKISHALVAGSLLSWLAFEATG